jgi:3-phenylpropionate/cinnamic acid dioxygenase small subunit
VTPEERIRRTLALYCQLCDDGRFDEWADLYVEDAEFHVMGTTHRGRAAIKAFIEKGQPPERRGKHLCANPLIDLDEGGTGARAVTDYVFVGRAGGGLAITSAGRYHDRLVLDGGRWRFARREIVFMGDQPAG